MTPEEKTLMDALAAPFPAECIGWKPGIITGNRALALAYIDARDVMNRLDAVVGVAGWEDSYEQWGGDGAVLCRLRVRLGEAWITKTDVGGASDQPDKGDKAKAAVSDALKRAAAKLGVGRYLYALPVQWAEYDPAKRCFVRPPQLPAWALPKVLSIEELRERLKTAAVKGLKALEAEWHRIGEAGRKACAGDLAELKRVAQSMEAA